MSSSALSLFSDQTTPPVSAPAAAQPTVVPTPSGALECISGTVEQIGFENEETGFRVFRLSRESDTSLTTKVVGVVTGIGVGMEVRLWGQWERDRRERNWYEKNDDELQFHATKSEASLPITISGCIKYIESNKTCFAGVGAKLATGLVAHFGPSIFQVLEGHESRVSEVVKGKKQQQKIAAMFVKHRDLIQTARPLQKLRSADFTDRLAMKVIEHFGADKIDGIFRLYPYRLTEVRGIGFKKADALARKNGVSEIDPNRLMAGALFALEVLMDEGNTGAPRAEVEKKMAELLGVTDAARISAAVSSALSRASIQEDLDLLFLPYSKKLEESLADMVIAALHLRRTMGPRMEAAADAVLDASTLSDEQKEAVRRGIVAPLFILTGGPGVGKTTTLKAMVDIYQRLGKRLAIVAPTGKAAQRAAEVTGVQASTIHRLLGGFRASMYDEVIPLDHDVVICDETSMCDLDVTEWLFRAVDFRRTQLILVGDRDQIPSVGHGETFANLIDSERVPVGRLTKIYRQAESSRIVTNAHAIIKCQMPDLTPMTHVPFDEVDFHYRDISIPDVDEKGNWTPIPEEARSEMECAKGRQKIAEAIRYYVQKKGADPVRDIQILSPKVASGLGVRALNVLMQDIVNPTGERGPELAGGDVVRQGDKVIAIKNNRRTGVFNGEMGVVLSVNAKDRSIVIDFSAVTGGSPRIITYSDDLLRQVMLAWAITVHRSQGSEFKYVILPWHTSAFMMLKRRLLYTAITRGKTQVVLVSKQRAIDLTIAGRVGDVMRHTRVAERVRKGMDWAPRDERGQLKYEDLPADPAPSEATAVSSPDSAPAAAGLPVASGADASKLAALGFGQ